MDKPEEPTSTPAPFKLPAGDDLPKLPYAKLVDIRQNHPEDYKKLLLSCIRTDEKAKSLANFYGKMLCLEQRRYYAGIKDGLIMNRYSFREWFEMNHGKFPGRAYSSAKVFDAFVLDAENHARYVPETVYDLLTTLLVNATSKVVNSAKRLGFGLDHQVFIDAAAVLKTHGISAEKQMEEIEARLVWDSKTIGQYETRVPAYLTKDQLTTRIADHHAMDSKGVLYEFVEKNGLAPVVSTLLVLAGLTHSDDDAKLLAQMAAQINAKLAENVVETNVATEAGGWKLENVPRFSQTQIKKWQDEVSGKKIPQMSEKNASAIELPPTVANLTKPGNAAILQQSASPSPVPKIAGQKIALKRWRGAEQQVLDLLCSLGWQVEDVSRQNIGYDIGGCDAQGEDAFVEVKSLDNPRQPFTLTSNEEAVAREKGAAYRLTLVRQTDTHLEVAFIRDPARHLKLTRQCRQWVWECNTYEFLPERFPLE